MTRRRDTKTARIIGVFIRKAREKKFPGRGGKSEAARAFGVHPVVWGGWELGKSVPDDVNQRKLAKFFGVTLAELRGDHRSPPTDAGGEKAENEIDSLTQAHGASARILEGLAAIHRAIAHTALDPALAVRALDKALDAIAESLRSPPTTDTEPPDA